MSLQKIIVILIIMALLASMTRHALGRLLAATRLSHDGKPLRHGTHEKHQARLERENA